MRTRSFVAAVVGSLVVAACGGGSDEADDTVPEVTLVTTTTSLPVFEPSDSVPATDVDTSVVETTPDSVPIVTEPVVSIETTIAPTTAPATTSAPQADFVLGTNGLGSVSFGADPDGVITFVTSFLGGATADTGWVDPFTIGACGGTQLRQVSWNDLQLEFGDVSNVAEGRPHFYAYYYGKEGSPTATPGGLATAEGITIGSTVAELLQAYPGILLRSGDEFTNDSFFVNDNLTGRLSGLADPDLVEMVIGGIPCDS
jgi:hypothetical protein